MSPYNPSPSPRTSPYKPSEPQYGTDERNSPLFGSRLALVRRIFVLFQF